MLSKTITAVLLGSLTSPLMAQSDATNQSGPMPLFEAIPLPEVSNLYPDEAAVLQRQVRVNLDLLGNDDRTPEGPEAGVLINLFEGVEFVGVFEGFSPAYGGGYIAEFAIQGSEDGHAFFSVLDDAVVATVQVGTETYKVNYVGDGQSTVSFIDPMKQAECGCDETHMIKGAGEIGGSAGGSGNRYTDHEIDVMVVYTDNARATNGGTNGINALINLAVKEANWAYSRSDIFQRLMLVHTQEFNWVEDGDDGGYLSDLRGTTDGVADDVHALRTEYGADMVSLIYDTGSYCGVAYIMTTLSAGFESSCFSVVADSCATGYYSFAHELGHNMGSAHDRANAGSALTSYSYGWRTTDNAYRTVMAYAPGTRIAMFSNPGKVAPNGLALGTVVDNNAASINTSSTTISAFRNSRDYGHRVSTTMASNNGFAGNMFDLKPKADIEIWALGVNTVSTVSETFQVWVREGGYLGYETNAGAWELWGTSTVTGSGQDVYTFIYPGTRSFEAGKTYGVFINETSYSGGTDTFRYTNGDNTYENNYLRIEAGVGRGTGGFAASVIQDRTWNGAVYYRGDSGQVQLPTTMASNNQFAGNMFDVAVKNNIVINSFDVNIDASAAAGTAHVDVYMKTGSYSGSDTDPYDWTYIGTDLAQVASTVDTYTRVSVGDIALTAGQTYSFYIHLASYDAGHLMRYTNGTSGAYVENSDMRVYHGLGKTNIAFGSSISNRQWNGRINYSGNHPGPHLWLANLKGGQTNYVRMAGCTPGARQYASWSVAGGGPQSSPWGTIYLSNPYRTLPYKLADSKGNVVISTFSPPQASGLTVWVQSLDVGTLKLTNGANLLIQ
jgi:hypothetical protein